VLAQAMLLVAGDVNEGTRMASRFYELAGGELRFLPDTSTTLANCIGWRGSEEQLVTQVRRRLQARLTGN
jgi:octanoyl-[GcvH]:protein N-octanoyltransferase